MRARRRSGLVVSFVAAALCAACAGNPGHPVSTADVPAALQPAGEKMVFAWSARGVQIYDCKAGANGAPAWVFVAPEAELFDSAGAKVGDHGAGPYWQNRDGSKVIGTLKQRADAPDAGAVPWLLLSARQAGGPGALARVTSIQRVHTKGGVAPEGGCASGDVGRQVRVPYTADYVFYETP